MMLTVGSPAIDFSLYDELGKLINLIDFQGKKIVLYFYPKDDTPGCTKEACAFRDVYDEILQKGAVVIGISKDSQASHAKFKKKYNLPFFLLSDPDQKAIKAYGAWGKKKMMGKEYEGTLRITYIIDENFRIKKVFPQVSPQEHAREILDSL